MANRPIWDKGETAHEWVTRFTVGDDPYWDQMLFPYDVAGTRAHAQGLVSAGVLTNDEGAAVGRALTAIDAAWQAGQVSITVADEDMHTVLERMLVDQLGDVGKKIHTGRSRNDQVLTALRLFTKEQLHSVRRQIITLARALCDLGQRSDHLVMPGYTHQQRAMPTTAGQWALAYAELLIGDIIWLDAAMTLVDRSPLGSAAGYGVPSLTLPRTDTAAALGFSGINLHVASVQLERGKLESGVLHACLQTTHTLNRIASDIVMFRMSEFDFLTFPKAYGTGSSIMPQKLNPDVAELVRGSYHRVLAEFTLLATLPSGLMSGYHRDLQLTKGALMRGLETTQNVLEAMNHLVPAISFNEEAMRGALTPDLLATQLALDLVGQGVPFREAYRQAAETWPTLTVPDPSVIRSAYHVDGYPGRGQADVLRAHLDTLATEEQA
jgi:argininosuccinate lyase